MSILSPSSSPEQQRKGFAAHSAYLSGFSLVEIMVAMVIGMLGMIVMLQVFGAFEGQKRTTTGGSDALTSGAIALYGVQRDIRQSGWGIAGTIEAPLIGCAVSGLAATGNIVLAPVTINAANVAAGDLNTDTLLIVYGNGNGAVEGDQINAVGGSQYAVHTPNAFNNQDFVLAEPAVRPTPTCTLAITKVTAKPAASPNVNVSVGATDGSMLLGKLYNLGQNPKILAYRIHNGNLTVCDYRDNDCSQDDEDFWVSIANNMVMLRAQYGRDTTAVMDGIVNTYDQTTPTTACEWLRASAVQVALVARNSQPEKPDVTVTAAAPTWMGGTAIDLTASTVAPDHFWYNYRYRVFETVVPLRNITTIAANSSC